LFVILFILKNTIIFAGEIIYVLYIYTLAYNICKQILYTSIIGSTVFVYSGKNMSETTLR